MLEGIEILAQTEIMKNPDWISLLFTVMIIFILLGFLIAITGVIVDMWKIIACGTGIVLGTFVISFVISTIIPQEPTDRYEYQVTIDDTVSFTELYEKYEVVDQNGKIWTIRDKDGKETE